MIPIIQRAGAYLAKMPVSIQGQGGREALFAAAVALVRGFALSENDALPLLAPWNSGCLPPWPGKDLRQVLRSAATTSTRPSGYLLEDASSSSSSSYSYSSSRKPTAPSAPSGQQSAVSPTSGADPESEAAKKARQRSAWPAFHPLTHDHIRTIATQRNMLPDAVDLAHRWGFLKSATVDGIECFILHEGDFAQARRLDGKPFTRPDGTPLKAKNLAGSEGAFLGQRWLGATTHVLLVEGVVGLLEALAALALVNTAEAWSILVATSASARFARDPRLLRRLKGRHVHIVPDADETGLKAAASWMADLKGEGVAVSVLGLPPGCQDLGALITPEAVASGQYDAALAALFQA